MKESSIEECPVCWRSYSSTVVPTTISCGHSFCEECSPNLKRCALCRKSVRAGARVTNYSLLSLVSKLELDKKEMIDKQVETDRLAAANPRQPASKTLDSTVIMKILLKLVNVQALLGKLMLSNSKANLN